MRLNSSIAWPMSAELNWKSSGSIESFRKSTIEPPQKRVSEPVYASSRSETRRDLEKRVL